MTSVLIVENEPVMEAHTRREVGKIFPSSTIYSARTAAEALRTIKKEGQPDWILLDLGLPDARELQALHVLVPHAPSSKILVISGTDDQDVRDEAMRQGAFAFISKEYEVEAQYEALKLVLSQHVPVSPPPGVRRRAVRDDRWIGSLTKSEKKIVDLMRKGMSNKQIGQESDVTEATVKLHLRVVYRKAGLAEYTGNKRAALMAKLEGRRDA